jgi:hypothetical protein
VGLEFLLLRIKLLFNAQLVSVELLTDALFLRRDLALELAAKRTVLELEKPDLPFDLSFENLEGLQGIGRLTLQNDRDGACHSLAILATVIWLSHGCHRSVVIIGKATRRGGQVFRSGRAGPTAQKLPHLAEESGRFRMRLLRR